MAEDDILTALHIENYKSVSSLPELRIGKLTILSGANSSGKSSLFQPLLLLKQTVEATTDPGPLQIDGPNVFFTIAREQIFTRRRDGTFAPTFSVGVTLSSNRKIESTFTTSSRSLRLSKMQYTEKDVRIELSKSMDAAVIDRLIQTVGLPLTKLGGGDEYAFSQIRLKPRIRRERCFYSLQLESPDRNVPLIIPVVSPASDIAAVLKNVIHVPAFRDISPRNLAAAYTKDAFIGEFDDYVGSLVMHWQTSKNPKNKSKLNSLNRDLNRLNLAESVHAVADNDVELSISVTPIGAMRTEFNLSDVGFGVSQALSVLVALHAATPKHLVYVEEPESHLHPRAQFELAAVIVDSINRGSRVVIETHSAFLLLGLQEQIALGKISPQDVALHWTHLEEGFTKVESSTPSEKGSLGKWPVDFGSTLMFAQDRFLSAYEKRFLGESE